MQKADATRKISLRSPAEGEEMRSAIKYLQDLDDFYSQIARPRFGKRSGVQMGRDYDAVIQTDYSK